MWPALTTSGLPTGRVVLVSSAGAIQNRISPYWPRCTVMPRRFLAMSACQPLIRFITPSPWVWLGSADRLDNPTRRLVDLEDEHREFAFTLGHNLSASGDNHGAIGTVNASERLVAVDVLDHYPVCGAGH